MPPVGRSVQLISRYLPPNLCIFVGAIFLSNSVNVFTNVYGTGVLPQRSPLLLASCIGSVIAAGLWTALAGKTELIEKTVLSASQDARQREVVRAELWNDVWRRVAAYICGALVFSVGSLVVLVWP